MKLIEVIRLRDKIQGTEFSTEALQEAADALASIKSEVDSRMLCRTMSETWQQGVVPLARELLASKRAAERTRGLELFSRVADVSLIGEVEAAKERERSKKLLSSYDLAVRSIRAAWERDNPAADPLDTAADPLARMLVLANLPYQQLWDLTGIRERYWGHIGLPTVDVDPTATQEELDERLAAAVEKRLRRLTAFLRSGQTQPYWLAQLLYVAHPLARPSATQLVWEAKVDGRWVAFRGTTDGGARDAAGADLQIDTTAEVRLAHPIELAAKQRDAWSRLAAAEGWSYPLRQLAIPTYTEDEVTLSAAVQSAPPLDERKMKAWLEAQGFESIWEHEHRLPHSTEHILSTDDCRPWLRVHHDAIVARRTGQASIRITRLEVHERTKRRHSEAVRLLRDLAEAAPAS